MERRDFLSGTLATAGAGLLVGRAPGAGRAAAAAPSADPGDHAAAPARDAAPATPARPFRLAYAPHFGMFRHHAGDDPVAQLEFMHAEGFRALEDNGMRGRAREDQERIARALERLEMRMGVFVAHADFGRVTFASPDGAMRDRLLSDVRESIEVAKRVNATWCTVVPGRYDQQRAWEYQTATVIENLRRCADLCEPAGLVMVLEPLNPRDHPGLFLTRIPQAYQVCRAVGSPSCRILDDLYHQQITEGNLIPNIDAAWEEIAYFQVGDNPGRREPTTGEINYRNVFRQISARGFNGIVGMEHGVAGTGREGERALINAYRWCDDW
ncbi:MAG: TIM barrel protein [Phycisphaeraceae bacterium]|nr:TIM barrel protein [Phycisphaeraceae bacterium]